MNRRSRGSRPDLPYRLLAGVTPTRHGWVVVPAKLQGIQLAPSPTELATSVLDVLDARPPYQVIAIDAPLGLPDEAEPGGRRCDREARALVGPVHEGLIPVPPTRAAVGADTVDEADRLSGGLDLLTRRRLDRIREIQREMAPYRQRAVYEVRAELSFFQLNHDTPLQHPKRTNRGRAERRALLEARIPGVDWVLDGEVPDGVRPWHVLDACAALWTARRIVARAAARLPEDAEWDSEALRMEIVR